MSVTWSTPTSTTSHQRGCCEGVLISPSTFASAAAHYIPLRRPLHPTIASYFRLLALPRFKVEIPRKQW